MMLRVERGEGGGRDRLVDGGVSLRGVSLPRRLAARGGIRLAERDVYIDLKGPSPTLQFDLDETCYPSTG